MKNVLVCVTGQMSCARLISYGKELIDGDGGKAGRRQSWTAAARRLKYSLYA